eukprot:PhF_6_TR29828/c0_g1_i1/m.43796/K11663/ZNHIT1, VPS71; zinc finger HIT domain-containing protein 1
MENILQLSRLEALQDENAFLPMDVANGIVEGSSSLLLQSHHHGGNGGAAQSHTTGRLNVKKVLEDFKKQSGKATSSSTNAPNYFSATMKPSRYPVKPSCSVCGYFSSYTCTKCKAKFCSIPCKEKHNDTRCMKYLA